ncbi:rcc01693 family protein [Jannaschia aquimarina]|uniref:Phage tail assembly chaperone n=1 Tax=Jannaschia aquimarina TaxID=935700 RepID=A0A0D1DBH0_9RHOB|nr:rcc01693 family protein [Jannaschia aquimarina]KIT17293.1 hypothetical protein jaqu_10240 [Jannaschia aquimarina]SNT19781.1 phage conserved hypothetical protein [Jannaschia aquimarina]
MTGGLDWPALMRAGIRGIGLRPADFWEMTPAELAFVLGIEGGRLPMDRAALESLAAKYPDQKPGETDG